jgi:hypothetical protein
MLRFFFEKKKTKQKIQVQVSTQTGNFHKHFFIVGTFFKTVALKF